MTPSYWHPPSKLNSYICRALFGLYPANYRHKYVGNGNIFDTHEPTAYLNEYGTLNLVHSRQSKLAVTIKRHSLYRGVYRCYITSSQPSKGTLKEIVKIARKNLVKDITSAPYIAIGKQKLVNLISKHFTPQLFYAETNYTGCR